MTSSGLPLMIVAYHRGVDWKTNIAKPYHWSFFIRDNEAGPPSSGNKDMGIAHQLHGMPGSFHYDGTEVVNSNEPGSKCNEVDIGSVPRDKLDVFADICKATPVLQDETAEWNCQDWAIRVLVQLKEQGLFLDEWVNGEYVRGYLKEV